MSKAKNSADTIKRRRRKGTGTIIARDGLLSIRWREDGKVRQEATGLTDTKKNRAAAAEMLEKKTDLARSLSRQQRLDLLIKEQEEVTAKIARLKALASGHAPLTLGGLVDAFRKSKYRTDCSPAQLDRYCSRLSAFVKWAGDDVAFAAVDDSMAERYADVLESKFGGASYNKHRDTLSLCWAALAKSTGVDTNPWASLARKRNESHTRRALTDEEVSKILSTAEGEMRDLILIGLHTGMRLGDCARLTWENFVGETVQVKTAKTGALVAIPAKRLLAALGRREKGGYVLPSIAEKVAKPHGIELLSSNVVDTFEAAGVQTSIKKDGWARARADAGFHSLRHTFVSRATEAGIPVAIIKGLVGHASEQMTAHYAHLGGDAIEAAFAKANL